MQNAGSEMTQLLVCVFLVCRETHTLSANQSAQSTQSAQQTKLVLTRNVWTPAQECVEHMLPAELRTITLFAPVILGTPGTHLDSARELQHVCRIIFILGK